MANLSALKAGGVPSVYVGSTILSAATGDVAITGVGFKPRWIMVTGSYDSGAQTVNTNTGHAGPSGTRMRGKLVYNNGGTPTFTNLTTSGEIYQAYTSGNSLQATGDIKTFDADGFTIDKVAYAFACDIHWIVGR